MSTSTRSGSKTTSQGGAAGLSSHGNGFAGKSARMAAVSAVTNYRPISEPLNFIDTPASMLFGSNVFNKQVMKTRLPKQVFKALCKTIESGEKLDPAIADVVASAMKDWAIEKGATHYAHVPESRTWACEPNDDFGDLFEVLVVILQ